MQCICNALSKVYYSKTQMALKQRKTNNKKKTRATIGEGCGHFLIFQNLSTEDNMLVLVIYALKVLTPERKVNFVVYVSPL